MSDTTPRSLWLGVIVTPVLTFALGAYGLWRAPKATELELICVNLILLLFILFPRLRSKLLRRRTWVNSWLKSGHWLRGLLQGGAVYLAVQLMVAVPAALLLLIELQHITYSTWCSLALWGAFCALARIALFNRFSLALHHNAASVLAREWATTLFMLGAGISVCISTLYAERPDLSTYSLTEALRISSALSTQGGEGLFGDLIFLSALKEDAFWWLITRLPKELSGLPSELILLAQSFLFALYTIYQISVIFVLSQWFAGVLEIVDRDFFSFLTGVHPRG